MNKKTLLAFVLSLISILWSFASEDISWEDLRLDPSYLYGQGYGSTYTEADRAALNDLISKIAVGLSSEVIDVTNVVNTNGNIQTENAINLIVNSYSQATLTNTESILITETPQYCVVRYISREELNKVFKHREEKVFDLVRNAIKAERKGKIDDALRYYYWSLSLLKSLQYPNSIYYNDNGDNTLLITWIPEQIDQILGKLRVRVMKADDNNATLYFTYEERPVTSLDFSFFNGNSWTPLNSVKDGIAEIELRHGVNPNNLRIKYEYEFLGEAQIDSEIQSVMKIFKDTYFRKSEVSISPESMPLTSMVDKSVTKEYEAGAVPESNISELEVDNVKEYNKIIKKIIDGIKNNNYTGVVSYFIPEGWDMMIRLLNYGKAKLIGNPIYSFYKLDDGRVICRSLKMTFSFPNNHKTFTEDVTFTFNKDKKIETVAFGLGSQARADIFDKGVGVWDEKSKLIIATFLENYKTAFALKRIDYIENIFDDNAVIIVGSIVKRMDKGNANETTVNFNNSELVRYNQYTKNQYIQNLRRLFKQNEFINISFADNDIVKMGAGGEVYGIQIHQDYYSSVYGDTGYLFLLVDINNPDEPIIKVRTWQPERDPNINGRLPRNHPDYGIYAPGLF